MHYKQSSFDHSPLQKTYYFQNLPIDQHQQQNASNQQYDHQQNSSIANMHHHQHHYQSRNINLIPNHQNNQRISRPTTNNTQLNNLDFQNYSFYEQKTSSSSSSSLSSSTSSSSNNKNLIVQDNEIKLTSNLANFVSESQTTSNLPFQQMNCSLVWSNVNYKVNNTELNFNLKKPFNLLKQKEKLILNNVSGHLNTGELVALIGPSGVGKSSLLEILAGRRRKNTSGKVDIDLQHLKFQKLNGIDKNEFKNQEQNWNKIAFIPQKDYHLGWLTVYETLIYASKIKNCKLAKKLVHKQMKMKINLELYLKQQQQKQTTKLGHQTTKEQFNDHLQLNQAQLNEQLKFNTNVYTEEAYHQSIVMNIIKDLSLETCMNNFVRNCSGGQKRRISIALELLSQPRLILIDEPTTGLDFSSALKCIQTLRSLTMMNKPPGIIASIHQPSSLVLNQFHRVYALAKGGHCIYEGTVDNLVDHFSSFQTNCPLYFNPGNLSLCCRKF